MRDEHTCTIEPARALAAETLTLERELKAECRQLGLRRMREDGGQVLAGVAGRALGDGFGRALRDDLAAGLAAFRARDQ